MLAITFTLWSVAATCGAPLAKRHTLSPDGTIATEPYPHVVRLTSYEHEIVGISGFFDVVVDVGPRGHALLKGVPTRALVNESRAGVIDPTALTHYIELDLDGVRGFGTGVEGVRNFMAAVKLEDQAAVLQWSASSRVTSDPEALNAHLFILCRPAEARTINLFIRQLNLTHPILRGQIRLNRTKDGLRFPLDVQVNSSGAMLYIAPPIFTGRLQDPYTPEERTLLLPGRELCPWQFRGADATEIREQETFLINELRAEEGLRRKRFSTRPLGGVQVVRSPDVATVNEFQTQGRFLRMNLNGGHSFAYWVDFGKEKIVNSFKDEDAHWATSDLLPPDMVLLIQDQARAWREAQEQERPQGAEGLEDQIAEGLAADAPVPLAFIALQEDIYYVGYYYPTEQRHETYMSTSLSRVKNFLTLNRVEMPEALPTWRREFDPRDPRIIDIEEGFLNLYQASTYANNAQQLQNPTLPTAVGQLIRHVAGDDEASAQAFLQVLAAHLQYPGQVHVAQIFQGTTGTGKSALIHEILSPIFGRRHCQSLLFDSLAEKFNAQLEIARITAIEEVDVTQLSRENSRVTANLKEWITATEMEIRAKYRQPKQAKNFNLFILNSNRPDVWHLANNDRRFWVAPRQERPLAELYDTAELLANIKEELQSFTNYLMSLPIDLKAVNRPVVNEAKADMIALTEGTKEHACRAFREGDLAFFLEHGPELRTPSLTSVEQIFAGEAIPLVAAYKDIMRGALAAIHSNEPHYINYVGMFVLFYMTTGSAPSSKTKLGHFLAHGLIKSQVIWGDGKRSTRAFVANWHAAPETTEEYQTIL